ncbi:MAG: GlxA family transcriptional regulator [Gammaproteobacteria bacterium]
MATRPQDKSVHKVVCLAFDNAQILDITGPLEVFGRTARWLRDHGHTPQLHYTVEVVAEHAGMLRTSSGIGLHAERAWQDVQHCDSLFIAGGIGWRQAAENAALLQWIRNMVKRTQRTASVCTGALILAEAGLLHGRNATTHWAYCDELKRKSSDTNVDADAIYVKSTDRLYTSAGVTAGMDMALAMVEEDWGQAVALAVAQELVLYLKRPGGQSQFSRHLQAQQSDTDRIQKLQLWILDHIDEELSVEQLARQVAMSPRNFARRFKLDFGITPAKHVELLRVESARDKLQETRLPIEKIATRCGFGSSETLRRSFLRVLGVTPSEYRKRFSAAS